MLVKWGLGPYMENKMLDQIWILPHRTSLITLLFPFLYYSISHFLIRVRLKNIRKYYVSQLIVMCLLTWKCWCTYFILEKSSKRIYSLSNLRWCITMVTRHQRLNPIEAYEKINIWPVTRKQDIAQYSQLIFFCKCFNKRNILRPFWRKSDH